MVVLNFLRWALRVFFRLLYNEMAFTYDWVSWTVSVGQWSSWQSAALPYVTGPRVLEVAHGPGHLLAALAERGDAPVGFDLSPYMGRQAQRRLRARGWGTVPLARGYAQFLPFASGIFTSVLSTFPTEFIVDGRVIAEFYRVLAPGGRVVFVPTAVITSGAISDRLAKKLFQITGQSSDDWFEPFIKRYEAAGFTARVESVRLPRSVVTVVIAEKGVAFAKTR